MDYALVIGLNLAGDQYIIPWNDGFPWNDVLMLTGDPQETHVQRMLFPADWQAHSQSICSTCEPAHDWQGFQSEYLPGSWIRLDEVGPRCEKLASDNMASMSTM